MLRKLPHGKGELLLHFFTRNFQAWRAYITYELVPENRRLIDFEANFAFHPNVTTLCSNIESDGCRQSRRENLPKPREKRRFILTAKIRKRLIRFQKGFLNDVGCVQFSANTRIDLKSGKKKQIVPKILQKLPECGRITVFRTLQCCFKRKIFGTHS